MKTAHPLSLVLRTAATLARGLGLIALVHCGGGVATSETNHPDGGTPDGAAPLDGGNPDGSPQPNPQCPGSPSTPVGRPQPVACAVTPSYFDAGDVACTTLADCNDAGGTQYPGFQACRAGQCVLDQCLTDSDCASGSACICADQARGNAIHFNQCLVTQCRVDADCGAGGVCSASYGSGCGGLSGYYCHSASDTCKTSADCCDTVDSATPTSNECVYDTALGHFDCQATSVCAG